MLFVVVVGGGGGGGRGFVHHLKKTKLVQFFLHKWPLMEKIRSYSEKRHYFT